MTKHDHHIATALVECPDCGSVAGHRCRNIAGGTAATPCPARLAVVRQDAQVELVPGPGWLAEVERELAAV